MQWYAHFTSTSASWINQVEHQFAELMCKQLRQGTHVSNKQLETNIRVFFEKHSQGQKSFKQTKSANDTLVAVRYFNSSVDKRFYKSA